MGNKVKKATISTLDATYKIEGNIIHHTAIQEYKKLALSHILESKLTIQEKVRPGIYKCTYKGQKQMRHGYQEEFEFVFLIGMEPGRLTNDEYINYLFETVLADAVRVMEKYSAAQLKELIFLYGHDNRGDYAIEVIKECQNLGNYIGTIFVEKGLLTKVQDEKEYERSKTSEDVESIHERGKIAEQIINTQDEHRRKELFDKLFETETKVEKVHQHKNA